MARIKYIWNFLLKEPFVWLFYYFFQTNIYLSKFDTSNRMKRLQFMLQVALPIFCMLYLPMLLLQLFSFFINDEQTDLMGGLFAAAIGCLSGIAVAIAWDFLGNIPVGVTTGIWIGFWMEICMSVSWRGGMVILLSTMGGIALGAVMKKPTVMSLEGNSGSIHQLSEKLNTSKDIKSLITDALADEVGGIVVALSGGISQRIEEYPLRRIGKRILLSMATGLFLTFVLGFVNDVLAPIIFLNAFIVFPASIMGGLAMNLIEDRRFSMVVGVGGGLLIGAACGTWSDVLSFIIALIPCLATTIVWLIGLSVGMSASGHLMREDGKELLLPIFIGVIVGMLFAIFSSAIAIIVGFIFFLCYIISYYKLSLYPINIASAARTEKAMRKDPSQVFTLLSQSTLYRDEFMSLPLNYLEKRLSKEVELGNEQSYLVRKTLPPKNEQVDLFTLCPLFYWEKCFACIAKQDAEQALQEITFIVTKRPFLISAAQTALGINLLEGIRRREQSQEERKTLRDIAEISGYLDGFRRRWEDIVPYGWLEDLNSLNYASEDAGRFLNSLSWGARHDALKNMVTSLQSLKSKGLQPIAQGWRGAAGHELNKLEQEPRYTARIKNPYVDSQALQLRSPLFKGRGDVLKQLEESLEQADQRTTFFLNGERRMGKTSTLRQLPSLLNPHSFIPIVYDLQGPEMTANIAVFLGAIAEQVYRTMSGRKLFIELIEKEKLLEARKENEATVYFVFNEWLKLVEKLLEENDLTLFLCFDEFEALEIAWQVLDLRLLLNWFRSIVQNRPRIALLFSGGRAVDEMGVETNINWPGYFVNVKTLRVSFLRDDEARQLITQPEEYYPIEQVFGEGVVEEIIRVTGCHPFLIQTVSSTLVNNLNLGNRDQAEIPDVAIAVDQVLDQWWAGYFQDLWNRTDQGQRACLKALHQLKKGTPQELIQHPLFGEEMKAHLIQSVEQTLKILLKRDLIKQEADNYRIAAPIFSKWVERNN